MSFSDPIGDMIARIRNGQMRSHNKIEMPASTFKGQILDVLKKGSSKANTIAKKNLDEIYIKIGLSKFT